MKSETIVKDEEDDSKVPATPTNANGNGKGADKLATPAASSVGGDADDEDGNAVDDE